MKARKKPVKVEVMQLRMVNTRSYQKCIEFIVEVMQLKMCSARSYRKCKEFVGDSWIDYDEMSKGLPGINTLEGVMEISNNDFIIKGVNGEFYPCKPEIFEKTYEVIE